MRRLLTIAAIALCAVPAAAADLKGPVYTPRALPLPEPGPVPEPLAVEINSIFDGAYGGLHWSYGWGNVDTYYDRAGHGLASQSPEGPLGGLTFGYNWRYSNFLLGVEADLGLGDISAGQKVVYTDNHPFNAEIAGLYATTRLRAGYVWNDWVLLYGTIGGIWSQNNNFTQGDNANQDAYDEDISSGLVWGLGLEVALNERSSLDLSYQQADFGRFDGTSANNERFWFESDYQAIRAALKWKF